MTIIFNWPEFIQIIVSFLLSAIAIIISVRSLKVTTKLQQQQFDIDLFNKRFDLLSFYYKLGFTHLTYRTYEEGGSVLFYNISKEEKSNFLNSMTEKNFLAELLLDESSAKKINTINNFLNQYFITGQLPDFTSSYKHLIKLYEIKDNDKVACFLFYISDIIKGIMPLISPTKNDKPKVKKYVFYYTPKIKNKRKEKP